MIDIIYSYIFMKYHILDSTCTLILRPRRFKHGLPTTRVSQVRNDPPGQ